MKKRFTDDQIIGFLREAEVGVMSIKARRFQAPTADPHANWV